MKFLIFLSSMLVVLAQGPPTLPPESFLAQVDLKYSCQSCDYSAKGTGHMGRDVDQQSQVEEFETVLTGKDGVTLQINTFVLWHFDLNPPQNFTLAEWKTQPCQKEVTEGKLFMMWEWLKLATNTGNVIINGHNVTMWNYTDSATGIKLSTGLEKHDDNPVQPYYYYMSILGNITQFIFNDFRHEPPHDQHNFEIPEECEQTNSKAYQLFNGFFNFGQLMNELHNLF